MAAMEMYDYLVTMPADYTAQTLNVTPQLTLIETADKNQVVYEYDNGGVDVVTLSNTSVFRCTLQWKSISVGDAGTIFDFFNDSNKANGRARTFYYQHVDGHTYVARFMDPLSRSYGTSIKRSGRVGMDTVALRIEGRKAD